MNHSQMNDIPHDLRSSDDELGYLLRTQLNIILGHAQILSFNPHLDQEGRNQIDEINHACQVILDYATEFLDSSSNLATPDTVNPPALAPPLSLGHRILVVEDNPANRALLEMQLENLGYEADVVEHSQQALHLWSKGGYGLILTDLNLNGTSGLDLALNIRMMEQEQQWPRIAIVALTAATEAECWNECRQVGIDALLSKPVTLEKLCELLRKYCLSFPTEPIQSAISPPSTILLDIYIQSARALLTESRNDLVNHNRSKLAERMHSLKSSSASAGASALARQAEMLEHYSRHADWNDLASGLDEIADLFENFCRQTPSSATLIVPAIPNIPANTIKQAIDNGDFSLDYIPYTDVDTLCPAGLSACFSSRKTEWGNTVPIEVILFLVERFGLFNTLSEQLMTRALLAMQSWQQAGHTLRLLFPVSGSWLQCSRVSNFIRASLKVTRVVPGTLSLEVAPELCHQSAQQLASLCQEGVGLTIDDLTRSHYTPAQLRQMGYTQTRFSVRSSDHASFDIPNETGLTRIVTDVASHRDIDQARTLGADFMQGPLIGQAFAEESLADWLATQGNYIKGSRTLAR